MENYFNELNSVDCTGKIEKKNGLSYLSWAYAWAEVKKKHPDANYTVYENKDGWNYFTDGRTGWVKTGVTVNGIEHIEYLPIMDFRNKSIPVDNITSFDVNKSIQRSLTKACARHGLGLYIYAGEDLPEDSEPEKTPQQKAAETRKANQETKEEYIKQYEAWMGWFAKHTGEITTKSIIAVELTISGLQRFSLTKESDALRGLLEKAKGDKIPEFQPEEYLRAG
jgi:hypothetical protein